MKRSMKDQDDPKGVRFVLALCILVVLLFGITVVGTNQETQVQTVAAPVTTIKQQQPDYSYWYAQVPTTSTTTTTVYVAPATTKATRVYKEPASNGDTTTSNEPYTGNMPKGCIAKYESGGTTDESGDYTHSGGGKYQIIRSTWNGYGGYSNAEDAPPSVQEAKAEALWANGAGKSHWRAQASRCGF